MKKNDFNVGKGRIKLTKSSNKKSVIGKHNKVIPNKHKTYFEVDDNNKVTSYKRQICIDRAELKGRLSKDEINDLLDKFKSYKKEEVQSNGYIIIWYVIDLREKFGVYIKLRPYKKSVNAQIQLHSKFTNNLNGNTSIILNVLNNHKWFITRLDIAIDYTTPFTNSAFLKRNGNQKQENYATSSWAGSTANPNKTAVTSHYDRKAKDKEIESKFINRFEVKLFFNEVDNMTFCNLNHRLIMQRLQKEMFIPCLTYSNFDEKKVKTNREQKKGYIELIKRAKEADNENYLKLHVSPSTYQTFRNHFKACRDDLEWIYIENSHLIFDFLLEQHY